MRSDRLVLKPGEIMLIERGVVTVKPYNAPSRLQGLAPNGPPLQKFNCLKLFCEQSKSSYFEACDSYIYDIYVYSNLN